MMYISISYDVNLLTTKTSLFGFLIKYFNAMKFSRDIVRIIFLTIIISDFILIFTKKILLVYSLFFSLNFFIYLLVENRSSMIKNLIVEDHNPFFDNICNQICDRQIQSQYIGFADKICG